VGGQRFVANEYFILIWLAGRQEPPSSDHGIREQLIFSAANGKLPSARPAPAHGSIANHNPRVAASRIPESSNSMSGHHIQLNRRCGTEPENRPNNKVCRRSTRFPQRNLSWFWISPNGGSILISGNQI